METGNFERLDDQNIEDLRSLNSALQKVRPDSDLTSIWNKASPINPERTPCGFTSITFRLLDAQPGALTFSARWTHRTQSPLTFSATNNSPDFWKW
jgi:hypothetical protein